MTFFHCRAGYLLHELLQLARQEAAQLEQNVWTNMFISRKLV